jgi:hypothetical protein
MSSTEQRTPTVASNLGGMTVGTPAMESLGLPSSNGAGLGTSATHLVTDRRRWLQLALATVWVIDGLLQYQTYMFTRSFATQILAPTADGNPRWISDSILWAAHIVETNPVWTNAVFATLQLCIGLALAWRRAVRPALVVSIVWSLLVWWFGEGLGGLLLPGQSALAGAPGAVLLYAVLAALVWPTKESTAGSFVASKPIGTTSAKVVWFVLWGGLAAVNLEPANLTAQSVHGMVDGMGSGQPGWLNALITDFTNLSAHNGVVLTVSGTVILGLIAVGVFLPPPFLRVAVIAALVVSAFVWVFGEALGALFGGQGTDVNSGPLLALIALAYWPRPVGAAGGGSTAATAEEVSA